MSVPESPLQLPLGKLRGLVRARAQGESCELCGRPLAEEHQHLLEPKARRLACSCDACAILFDGNPTGRFRRVPRRIEWLADFQMTDDQWENLHLPISMAFFYFNSPVGRQIAMFPSPAGATESLLTLEAWDDLVAANPVLRELEPDVEALLVNRVGNTREYCRAPIDKCFELVGLIRMHWRGLSGGTEVWRHITRYFNELKEKSATPVGLNGKGADA